MTENIRYIGLNVSSKRSGQKERCGTGYREFLVLSEGRRLVRLLYIPKLTVLSWPREILDRSVPVNVTASRLKARVKLARADRKRFNKRYSDVAASEALRLLG